MNIEFVKNLDMRLIELCDIDSIEYSHCVNMIDIEVEDDNTFVLSNGIISHNSALSPLTASSNPKVHGLFPLKGKPENCFGKNTVELMSKELLYISTILNLSITKPNYSNLRYHKIAIATDADCLARGTVIVTENGPKNIEDVEQHDKVLTHTGEYKEVTKVTISNKDSQLTLETKFGNIDMSMGHKMFVYRNNQIIEVYANDILMTDKLLKLKS